MGLHSALSQRGEHLQAISSWKHEVQDDEVEFLRIHEEESFFSGGRDDDFVLLPLQSLSERPSHLRFVFNDEHSPMIFRFLHLAQVFSLQSCTV